MSATISAETSTAVIPAPRRPADGAPRRQRPADQYWNVVEACWCVAQEGVAQEGVANAGVTAAAGIS